MKTFKLLAVPMVLSGLLILTSAKEVSKEQERVEKATTVMHDFAKMKESIPSELINKAEGVLIIPNTLNGGFVIAAKRGKGVALVRNGSTWSNPAFVTLTGGSFGLQAGVQSIDLVLIFKHKSVLTKVENGDFTIGGDISAAVGPVGRSSTASTDYKLDAEVYSYSRSKGLFAGISVNGANISIDKDAIKKYYGANATSQTVFETSKSPNASVTALKTSIAAL